MYIYAGLHDQWCLNLDSRCFSSLQRGQEREREKNEEKETERRYRNRERGGIERERCDLGMLECAGLCD